MLHFELFFVQLFRIVEGTLSEGVLEARLLAKYTRRRQPRVRKNLPVCRLEEIIIALERNAIVCRTKPHVPRSRYVASFPRRTLTRAGLCAIVNQKLVCARVCIYHHSSLEVVSEVDSIV